MIAEGQAAASHLQNQAAGWGPIGKEWRLVLQLAVQHPLQVDHGQLDKVRRTSLQGQHTGALRSTAGKVTHMHLQSLFLCRAWPGQLCHPATQPKVPDTG